MDFPQAGARLTHWAFLEARLLLERDYSTRLEWDAGTGSADRATRFNDKRNDFFAAHSSLSKWDEYHESIVRRIPFESGLRLKKESKASA